VVALEILQLAVPVGAAVVVILGTFVALRRMSSSRRNGLLAELKREGETIELGPESGLYRGSNAPSLPRVKGNAVIALTERRLCIRPLVGRAINIDRAQVVGVREDMWFLGAMTNMLPHLILRLRTGGEVGVIVLGEAHTRWLAALKEDRQAWQRPSAPPR
jgi:hypothetical protein